MSLASIVVPLQSALRVPSTRIHIDSITFVSYVLPPVICFFVQALLALTPQTYTVRVALWPLMALLALRAVLSVDVTHGRPEFNFLNHIFLLMLSGSIRSLGWTMQKKPLVRRLRPRNTSPSTILDVLDLVFSFRGHGWEWSRGLYVPRETRPTDRTGFALYALLSAIVHAFICGAFHRAVLTFLPVGVGPIPGGSTLFDETLPFLLRYLRASIISTCAAIMTYGLVQMSYDLCTIVGILICGQDSTQWPPAFDAPWRATSLSDFWGRSWHQFLRQIFLLLGGYPLSLVLGSSGIVIGSFLISALWHYISLLTLYNRGEMWWMLVGFGMMAPGILVERAFHYLTGRRVGGIVGWFWTMVWLQLWGSVMFEGFARVPMLDRSSLLDVVPSMKTSVERLAMGFDDWLRDF